MKKFALATLLVLLLALLFAAFYRHQTRPPPATVAGAQSGTRTLGLKLSTRLSRPGSGSTPTRPGALTAVLANRWLLLSMGFLGVATVLGAGAGRLLGQGGETPMTEAAAAQIVRLKKTLATQQAGQKAATDTRTQLADATAGLSDVRSQTEQLGAELTSNAEQIDQLDERLRESDRELEEFSRQLTGTQDRAEDLGRSLASSHDRIATLDSRVADANEQIATLHTRMAAETATRQELKERLSDRDETIRTLDEQAGEIREKYQAAEQEARELAGYRDKLSAWGSSIDTFERDLRDRDRHMGSLREEVEDLIQVREDHAALCEKLTRTERRIQQQDVSQRAVERQLDGEQTLRTELEQDLSELDIDRRNLRAMLDQQQIDGEHLRERIARLSVDLYESELQIATQSEQLSVLVTTNERDKQSIRRLEDDAEKWQDRLPPLESRNHVLAQCVESLSQDLAAEQSRSDQERVHSGALRQQLGTSVQEVEDREQRITELTISIETEREAVAELDQQIRGIIDAKTQLADWRSTIDTFRMEVRHKTALVDELNDKVDVLRDENRELRDQTQRIGELESSLQQKTALAKTLKEGTDSMRGYKETAVRQAGEIKDLQFRIDDLRRDKDSAVAKLDAGQDARDGLHAQIEERGTQIDTLSQSLQARELEITGLEEKLILTRRDYGDLQDRADESRHVLAEIEAGLAELDQSGADIAALLDHPQLPLTEPAATIEDDADRIADTRNALTETLASLHDRLREMDEASAAAEELNAALDQQRATNVSLQADLQRAGVALSDLRAQAEHHAGLSGELDETVARNRALCADADELLARNKALAAQAQTEREHNSDLEKRSAELQQSHDDLDAQLAQERLIAERLDAEISSLREQDTIAADRLAALQNIEHRAQALETDSERLRTDIADRERDVNAMLAEIGAITEQRVTAISWRQELASIMRDLGTKDARIDELARYNVSLREQMQTLSENHRSQSEALRTESQRLADATSLAQGEVEQQLTLNQELQQIIAERDEALENLNAAAEGSPAVPVLRDALEAAPPVLTTIVSSGGDTD